MMRWTAGIATLLSLVATAMAATPDGNLGIDLAVEVIAAHGVGDGQKATAVPLGRVTDIATSRHAIYAVDATHLRVRRIDADGSINTVFNGFDFSDGAHPYAVATDGASGRVYVLDKLTNRIWAVDGGTATAVAGIGTAGFSGDGGRATAAEFRFPQDLTVASSGTLYVADTENNRIRQITPDGRIITVAGTLDASVEPAEMLSSGSLYKPEFVAVGDGESIYVVDRRGTRLQRIDAAGAVQELPRGPATITGVAVGPDGYVWIASGGRILRLVEAGWISPLAPPRDAVFASIAFEGPQLIAYNQRDSRLYRLDAGAANVVAGSDGLTPSDEGEAADGAVFSCHDVAVDSRGRILFTDPANARVAAIRSDGAIETVATAAADGSLLALPLGIAVDPADNVFVADGRANQIVKITPAGATATIALRSTSGAADAALSTPRDVVVDPDGDLIVSDSGNQRVVRVDADGRVSELARLDFQPQSLAYDAKGLLVISGRSGAQLIVVTPAGELEEEAVGGAVDAALRLDADAALAPEADGGSGGQALRPPLSVRAVREMVSTSGGAPDGRGGLIVCDEQRGRILRVTRVGGGDAPVAAEP